MRLSLPVLAWLMLCVATPASAAPPGRVQASYDIYKSGLKVGRIDEVYTLKKDRYTLSSTTIPVGILAIFKPERIFVESSGLVGKQGLQPLHFDHRRELDQSKNTRAEFDWKQGQLTLIHQTQQTVVALPEGTQDRLSAMYQFMFLPMGNTIMLNFPMTNGKKLDNYAYSITRGEKLKTPAGEFNTLYLDNHAGTGESRTEIWLATQRYNLPCRMTITDADGDQITQVLSKLEIR
ncbi:MAG: DUF3108 domain-containing protein [Nitrosomonadales bacterium]|nr:DUF3108 domain-containing protein [Nitrosomonadales bacterium]